MFYFKRNIGDYHKKAGRLSMLEHGAYTLLIDSCYDRERFPTRDEAVDWCWARTADEIASVEFVLSKFFDLIDGRFVQQRIKDEIANYHKNAATNKGIAIEREAKNKTNREDNRTNRERIVNESTPNHEPVTKNQEPYLIQEPKGSMSAAKLPDCQHDEILKLWGQKFPHLTQPRSWTGSRKASLKARWAEASKPSGYSDGYTTVADGLAWWGSFFDHIAKESTLGNGFETNGRIWRPDLPWMLIPTNFAKITDGKYRK